MAGEKSPRRKLTLAAAFVVYVWFASVYCADGVTRRKAARRATYPDRLARVAAESSRPD